MFIFNKNMKKNRIKIHVFNRILASNGLQYKAHENGQLVYNSCKDSLEFGTVLSTFSY